MTDRPPPRFRGARRDPPARVLAAVRSAAREGREEVRLVRPFGWTREEFAGFLEAHAARGLWTHTVAVNRRGVDVATLRVTAALLEE